jgi:hypothetical protein
MTKAKKGPSIVKALGLNKEQAQKLHAAHKKMEATAKRIHGNNALSEEEKKAPLHEAYKKHQEKLAEFLSEEQLAKLRAIHRQNAKPQPRPNQNKPKQNIAKALGLSEEQKRKWRALHEFAVNRSREILNNEELSEEEKKERIRRVHETVHNRREEILTVEQQTILSNIRAQREQQTQPVNNPQGRPQQGSLTAEDAGEPIDTPRSDLRVSLGRISQTKSGYLTVLGPKERAVRTSGEHSNAVLQFRYRGPSETISLLDSGALVRQIGLKMRAMDTCNLLYVMWRIKPTEEIYIAIKRNPGESKYKECLSRGYLQLARVPLKPLGITAATQKEHRLGASVTETDGRYTCTVTIDGRRVWSDKIDAKHISDIKGPVGIRSDNGSFIFKLFVTDTATGNK